MSQDTTVNSFGWRFEHSYRSLASEFYSTIGLQPVPQPELLIFNQPLANGLGLERQPQDQTAWALMLSGSQLPPGAVPTALAYAGHQFGHFTMLGDGRALWYGEQITPQGQRVDIQLKGSGPTPYARGGDGRAVLAPMLREYLLSEAMHALRIPTTRSLAVTTTGEMIYRSSLQPGAILTRVAASHIRVGTFEYAACLAHPQALKQLLDYTVNRHLPAQEITNQALALLHYVKQTQTALICEWLRIGFIHGVMNTDNMAISGETIDYGPCAFMDEYHPRTVFSSIDQQGRYAFSNQASIAQWNFTRLVECLLPLLHTEEARAMETAQQQVAHFAETFERQWLNMMRAKLGLVNAETEDRILIQTLLSLLQQHQLDYTNTFRHLSTLTTLPLQEWQARWQARRLRQPIDLITSDALMCQQNPALIPRNHQVEKALSMAVEQGDLTWFERCLSAYQKPYEENDQFKDLQPLPKPHERVLATFCGT